MRFDHRLQDYLRGAAQQGRDVTVVGPFTVTIDPGTDMRFLNYAIPDADAPGAAEAIAPMRAAFRARGRRPRLEFVESVAPELPAQLRAAGFAEEARMPLMTCTPQELTAPPALGALTLHAQTPDTPDAELEATNALQMRAFGEDVVDDGAAERRRAWLARGGILVEARIGGVPVGAAQAQPPTDGLSELVGVAVAEEHRRRGIAAAVTHACTRLAFAAGTELAFLTPGDEGAGRVYARAGFTPSLTMLAYADPAEAGEAAG